MWKNLNENVLLPPLGPQSRQDASDFAGVAQLLNPAAPVAPSFHSPVDLAARVASQGFGLVFVPAGAVKASAFGYDASHHCLTLLLIGRIFES